jgi:Fe-S cluster biogenesis protein NfuA
MEMSQIEAILNEARPALMRHGGNIELISVDNPTPGIVKVRLQGACVGCPMSTFTMKLGIEKLLRERIPGIKDVIDVTESELGWVEEE